jgi:hypothetical protein
MIQIIGIKIIDRIKEAGLTQKVLSKHAGSIITRLGFHEVTDSVCSREACILLHLKSDKGLAESIKSDLQAIGGVIVREMNFTGSKDDKASDGIVEVLGILVERDQEVILTVQKVLTSFGCNIRTRLGVNEIFFGEPAGLIILELTGDYDQRALLEAHLRKIGKVHVRRMVF